MMGCMICSGGMGVSGKDLKNPAMTLENNPLADKCDMAASKIERRNMDRLIQDAHLRGCPTHGQVYSGIMDMRYKGE